MQKMLFHSISQMS